jgi:hypothetical protein
MLLPHASRSIPLSLAGLSLLFGISASAQDASPTSASAPDVAREAPAFLRVVEEPGKSLALEVSAWRFRRADGEGPEVSLVGVAHIGDAALYAAIEQYLKPFDIVLYESVKPAGAARPTGATDDEKAAATRESLAFLAGCVDLYTANVGALPGTPADLAIGLATIDPRIAQWVELAAVDGWGAGVTYSRGDSDGAFTITSLGSDGAPGGDGGAADIVITQRDAYDALALSTDDGLQAQLADMLNLEFQLDAIDYGGENWRCSDMTMSQLSRAMAARGIDFGDFGAAGGSLAGSGLPGKLVALLVRAIKLADIMFDGVMSDMAKVMMIEVLGDPAITEQALQTQFGGGFGEVLIGERNQVVMDDLKRIIDTEPRVKSIAIFYGAAHMPDFVTRLKDQLNYEPTEGEWITAIEVDVTRTALSPQDIETFRKMLRQSLRFGR